MTIKEIIDRERWVETADWGGLPNFFNKSLSRIEAAVEERIAELETALDEIAGYATIETAAEVTDIINRVRK